VDEQVDWEEDGPTYVLGDRVPDGDAGIELAQD
jgi:hypothetical protein